MGAGTIIRIVASLLGALARVAPEAVEALTGGQTVDEAIDAAKAAAVRIPVRGGRRGTWARDLEERKRGDD